LAVKSLLAQEANVAYEVIVVDNNSTDDTRERIQRLCEQAPEKLRYLFEKTQGASVARNAAIMAARGDIIAFIDDDALAQPGWLNALAETYDMYPDAWSVGGKIVLALPEELPPWFDRGSFLMSHLGRFDRGDATVEFRYPDGPFGGNFSVRRDVLDRVGIFDTTLGPAGRLRIESEETELCWRIQQAGGAIYYSGRAIVTHLVPAERLTKRYFRSRAYWGGRTWAIVDRKEILHVSPRDLLPAALRVAKNYIVSRISPSRLDRCETFEVELRFWQCLGYLQQTALTRFGSREAAVGARKSPTDPPEIGAHEPY
jgi:glycosyltransferase involved in cell wall biosynthesis